MKTLLEIPPFMQQLVVATEVDVVEDVEINEAMIGVISSVAMKIVAMINTAMSNMEMSRAVDTIHVEMEKEDAVRDIANRISSTMATRPVKYVVKLAT